MSPIQQAILTEPFASVEGQTSVPSVTLGRIAQRWVQGVTTGEVRYNPNSIASRWLTGPNGSQRFKVIYNAARRGRLHGISA
jgi:hypothetical protein